MSPLEAQQRKDFDDVLSVIDASNVAVELESLTVKRFHSGKRRGRPRRMTLRAFLTLAILTCLRDRPPKIDSITQTANELPEDLLEELGLKAVGEERPTVTKSQVGHLFNVLANGLDASAHRPGKRLRITEDGELVNEFKSKEVDRKYLNPGLTEDELVPPVPTRKLIDRSERPLPKDEVARRKQQLNELIDRLLQATIPSGLTIESMSVDWTDREAWASSYRRPTETRDGSTSADPEAKWGRRRPSGNSITPVGSKRTKSNKPAGGIQGEALDGNGFEKDKIQMFFGYIPHIAVAAPEIDGPAVPEIALALRVDPADDMAGVGPALVSMVDSVQRVTPVRHVLIDRGYSMRSPDSWARPLAERGVHVTFDLSKIQRQRGGTVHGAVLMGGDFYCPLTPREITLEGIPGPQANREDWAEFHRRTRKRRSWMMRLKGVPTASMESQRLECPALAGRLRCPLRPDSMAVELEKDIPEIYPHQVKDIAAAPPTCCTAKSFTVKQEHGAGRRQRYEFGTPEWIRSYDRRTGSERYISGYKENMRTGRRDVKMFGLTRQTLAVGFVAVALNIRLLRNWESEE